MSKFKFIDLFAGIGGFHQAMKSFGGECDFAAEIDGYAIETYRRNYGINSANDVTKVLGSDERLKEYEMLCAGFPCQAFSKAGSQLGFNDTRGTLFYEIARLLQYRIEKNNPVKYIMLENVRNLVTHDGGRTYKTIVRILKKDLGYILPEEPIIMGPHQIGIPQLRDRVFILGIHNSFTKKMNLDIKMPDSKISKKNITSAYDIVTTSKVANRYYLGDYEKKVLKIWDEFIKGVKEEVIGFPIWSSEFATTDGYSHLPKWKQDFIKRNRKLYLNNKTFIDRWLKKHDNLNELTNTHRKFEWQAGKDIKSVYEGIIQFRPSGVRVKRPTEFPALVAMVHIPIIGKYKRYLTIDEVSKLQSFPKDFIYDQNEKQALKQFGNSVNVDVIKYLYKELKLGG